MTSTYFHGSVEGEFFNEHAEKSEIEDAINRALEDAEIKAEARLDTVHHED